MPKVFLLGIDGATWKVLDRLIAQGLMPNLDRLSRVGARGVLNSTIPYITPVAWSSLLTGVNPSKHCIFGYNVMENRQGMIIGLLANRSKIKSPTVFDIYSQLGKKVISVNMPMTYPPRPEDGVIITGMMTPSRESAYYYPQDLMAELQGQGIDYQIDINISREVEGDLPSRIRLYLADNAERFFSDLRRVTESREKTVQHLLNTRDWDLFQVNFVSMDRIQHFLWKHIWEDDPGSPLLQRIHQHYAYVDSVIGGIYSRIKDDAILMICSDHGFGDYQGNFYPAVWLKQRGYFAERDDHLTPGLLAKRVLKALGLSRLLLRLLEKSEKTVAKKLIYVGTSNVSWRRTRAYVYSPGGIRINLKGRDQYGTVAPGQEFERLKQEITQGLLALKDEAGNRVVKAVYPIEEIYGVSHLEEAPDLLFEPEETHSYTSYDTITQSPVFLDRGYDWRQGDHRRDGVVLLVGDGVASGRSITADIEDVLPTILFAQDLPLGEYFDGKVMKGAFTEQFISSRMVKGSRSFQIGKVETRGADKGDEVIDRLKGLGYI